MIKSFILTTIVIACTNALEPVKVEIADGEIRDTVLKYINNIPDIENKYIINEGLSKALSRFFEGKISMLPLYKVNLKIDRNPIKIPWTIDAQSPVNNLNALA